VFDPIAEYSLRGPLRDRSTRTGYLARRGPDASGPLAPAPDVPEVLCLVGGGQDGAALASAFVRAPLRSGARKVVVAGPFMPPGERRAIEERGDATVLGAVPDCASLIARATAVVAMGGYNTVCELLAAGTRPLIVPRTYPRVEQLIRAERLAELGAIDMLHPDSLSPQALAAWIDPMSDAPRPPARHGLDLDGLDRLPALVEELLKATPPRPHQPPLREQEPSHVPA
jgi:predicted glycosyltransferase